MPVPEDKIQLSVLILSIPSRFDNMKKLYQKLQNQVANLADRQSVEILVLIDNCSKSISEKRNDLLRISRGKYVAFLDDDDSVGENYFEELTRAIKGGDSPDCITFNQVCYINGDRMIVSFGIGYPHGELVRDQFGNLANIKRPPYHMCAWRRDLAVNHQFNSVYGRNGQSVEDIDWLMRLYPMVMTEVHIDAVLHYYFYNSETTASVVPKELQ